MGEALDRLALSVGRVSGYSRVVDGKVQHVDAYVRNLMNLDYEALLVERDLAASERDRTRYQQVITEIRYRTRRRREYVQDLLRRDPLPTTHDVLRRDPDEQAEDRLARHRGPAPVLHLPPGR